MEINNSKNSSAFENKKTQARKLTRAYFQFRVYYPFSVMVKPFR